MAFELYRSENNKLYMQQSIDTLLNKLNISYQKYSHPPLHNCDEADKLNLERSGFRLKNLFLRDNYGRNHLLLVIPHDRQVNLKQLSKQLAMSRIGFCSPRRLQKYLGCRPGHLSLLALVNDTNNQVDVYIDKLVWQQARLQCHPLDNRLTYVIELDDIEKLLTYTGHKPRVIDAPSVEHNNSSQI